MFDTWTLAVLREMNSCSAIWLLDSPSATNRSTSASRAVRPSRSSSSGAAASSSGAGASAAASCRRARRISASISSSRAPPPSVGRARPPHPRHRRPRRCRRLRRAPRHGEAARTQRAGLVHRPRRGHGGGPGVDLALAHGSRVLGADERRVSSVGRRRGRHLLRLAAQLGAASAPLRIGPTGIPRGDCAFSLDPRASESTGHL